MPKNNCGRYSARPLSELTPFFDFVSTNERCVCDFCRVT